MIENLDDYLIGIATGVRFRANFSVEDQLGRILDAILYSQNSFFNPSVFPNVVNTAVAQRAMVNKETDDKLIIDNSNFILETQFGFQNGFKKEDAPNILQKFEEQIIKGIMSKYKIQQIIRVGLIKRYLFPIKDLAKTFVDKTVGETLEGVNDINLRFSKKVSVPEALVKQNVNDWSNAIFNVIKKSDADEIFMSVDYQLYYSPSLEKASQINFIPFTQAAENFNQKRYLPWINTNYMEA